MELYMENSCLEGDSNALILPAKKNKRRKGGSQENERVPKNKNPKLSKSQNKKLQKVEAEKEKALMLKDSNEAFKKYRISEGAYSLLRSSKNIGQVQTSKEKCRMTVQFYKEGLEVLESDQSFKTRVGGNSLEAEAESCQDKNTNDHFQPILRELSFANNVSDSLATCQGLDSGNELNLNGRSVSAFSTEELPCQDNFEPVQEDTESSSLALCHHSTQQNTQLMVKSDESLIVDMGKASNFPDCPLQNPVTTPTVVHVVRPIEVEEKRKDLPIVMMEQEIMEAINEHTVVIICGETGCGKTTQVPQFLYEAGFGSNHSVAQSGVIGVTLPRRVAVHATARRVAYELGLRLGREIGFQVRHDKKIGDNCTIKFMTDGILRREVQSDFLLKRYSVIILDEAHERSVNTDILIGMLARIIPLRQKMYKEQQQILHSGQNISPENMIFPLKLILMSATLRVEDFVSGRKLFPNPPPVIEVPTRQFPVTEHFSKKTEIVDYVGQAYKKVLSIQKRLPHGGILVFVTGQREVEYLCKKLRKASKKLIASTVERNIGNEVSFASEMNSTEGMNMKDINEAFEIQGNSSALQTDRYSSDDIDIPYANSDESDASYNSETDSELEIAGDSGDSGDRSILESDGNLLSFLGEEGSLASLKDAFEALGGKTASDPNSERKQIPSVSGACLGQSNNITGKKGGVKGVSIGALHVLPLYAKLPAAAHLRIFEEVKEGERLVVVATNVAETSLTIPGIKYVVDTGREKVKNYNPSNGMETYEIQWISKAAAAQRAGRAGRTGPGHCYRLYSSAVFSNIFPDFSCAEICKVPAEDIVLLLKSMSIKVEEFAFPTAPEATALKEAEKCLKTLEALDCKERLTPLGKMMAYFPLSPRHSRMLLTVIQIMRKLKNYTRANLVLGYAIAAAAALSQSNPFLMQFEGNHDGSNSNVQEHNGMSDRPDNEKNLDNQEKLRKKKLKETAKISRKKFSNPSSDALTIAYALQCFELSNSPVEFCSENALHLKTMEDMSKLRKQLLHLVFNQNVNPRLDQDFSWTLGNMADVERAWMVSTDKTPLLLNEEELLGQAICAGWVDRVAKRIRRDPRSSEGERKVNATPYQACVVGETVFLHRWSSLSKSAPEFLVYRELVHTEQPYMHGATRVKPEWLVKYAKSSCQFSDVEDPKPHYNPQTDQVYHCVISTFSRHNWQLPPLSVPVEEHEKRVKVFAYALLEGQVLPCLRSVRGFMAARPSIILDQATQYEARVDTLLRTLGSKSIVNCTRLLKVWKENPGELYLEILNWFQKSFHGHFGALWSQMHVEIQLEPHERFDETVKRDKRKRIHL